MSYPKPTDVGHNFLSTKEASRCLGCSFVCDKCVEVCPNRANVAIRIDGFKNIAQILHIDALCNECGNCETFCPYTFGSPYKNKITLFWNEKELLESSNDGFFLDPQNFPQNHFTATVRFNGEIGTIVCDSKGTILQYSLQVSQSHPSWLTSRISLRMLLQNILISYPCNPLANNYLCSSLKNANIIQFYPPLIREGVDVVLDGSFIVDVGKNISNKYQATKTIELADKYISPGIVCAHNHFYSALARGIQADIKPSQDFIGILKNLWWKLDRALDEESLYYSGLIGALEAIKAGTTSVIDHNASPSFIKGSLKTLKNSFEKVGLRGILAYEITDRNGETGMIEGIEESKEFCKTISREKKNVPHLIESAIGAHAPFTLSDRSLRLIADSVSSTKKGIHIHVAEDRYDTSFSHHHFGKDLLERLEDFSLLNKKAILVHGVYLSDRDIDIINRHDAYLIHNPRSNMNNSVGYMQKLGRVKNVGLGTDGIGSNMFEEAKIAFFKNSDMRGTLTPERYPSVPPKRK